MKKIETEKAPKAIGPYSQAVVVGELVFCSGQIALEPRSGEMVAGGIEEQTKQIFKNIEAVLAAAGTGLGKVVSVTVYLKSMADFPKMNAVYAEIFGDHKPARATVGVSELPKNALIEMACVATK